MRAGLVPHSWEWEQVWFPHLWEWGAGLVPPPLEMGAGLVPPSLGMDSRSGPPIPRNGSRSGLPTPGSCWRIEAVGVSASQACREAAVGITQPWSSGTWFLSGCPGRDHARCLRLPLKTGCVCRGQVAVAQALTASTLCPGVTTEHTIWGQIPGCSDLASLQCRDLLTHVV